MCVWGSQLGGFVLFEGSRKKGGAIPLLTCLLKIVWNTPIVPPVQLATLWTGRVVQGHFFLFFLLPLAFLTWKRAEVSRKCTLLLILCWMLERDKLNKKNRLLLSSVCLFVFYLTARRRLAAAVRKGTGNFNCCNCFSLKISTYARTKHEEAGRWNRAWCRYRGEVRRRVFPVNTTVSSPLSFSSPQLSFT